MTAAAAVVLAGGRSTRMGKPKAALDWHGSTLVRRAVGIVGRAVDGPVVVVRAPGQPLPALPAAVEVVEDAREGRGPLEGIAAGLAAIGDRAQAVYVCGVDAPLLHPAFVRRVLALLGPGADVALPRAHGFAQPLSAAYRTTVAAPLRTLLREDGQLGSGALLRRCRVTELDEAALLADPDVAAFDPALDSLLNLNEPGEYEAARARPAPAVTVRRDDGADALAIRAATLAAAAGAADLPLGDGVLATLNGQPADDPQEPLVAGDVVALRRGASRFARSPAVAFETVAGAGGFARPDRASFIASEHPSTGRPRACAPTRRGPPMSAQPTIANDAVQVGGPYWEELSVGDLSVGFPAMTLSEGHAALHQSIVGDRLRLALDASLSEKVAGRRLAHPMLVCDVSIGQSTLPTQRVIGNLFYRRLMLRRLPAIGDTLRTTTEIVALKRNTVKEGGKPTGLAVLHIVTKDQEERAILDYWRCAMLPIRDLDASEPHADDLDQFPADLPPEALAATLDGIDLDTYRSEVPGVHFADLEAPTTWVVDGGDSVTAATELARLSLNIAKAHTDPGSHHSGKRLVYGGHAIGIAAAQLCKTLPNLVTIIGWHHCNHLAPVFEGDVLRSTVQLEGTEALPDGGGLVTLGIEVSAQRADGALDAVLDWRLVGAMA